MTNLALYLKHKQLQIKYILSGLLIASSSFAAALPNAFHAKYAVSVKGLSANMITSLKYQGNQYSYQKSSKARGIAALSGYRITENTEGTFEGVTLYPEKYFYQSKDIAKTRTDNSRFFGRNVKGKYKDQEYSIAITPNTLDRASLDLALARDLSMNKPRLSYQIMERGKIKQYHFTRHGNAMIKTPAGTFDTVKLTINRKQDSKRQTTLWLAKAIDYLPVKIQHIEKGDTINTVLTQYQKQN